MSKINIDKKLELIEQRLEDFQSLLAVDLRYISIKISYFNCLLECDEDDEYYLNWLHRILQRSKYLEKRSHLRLVS